ncbi:DUF1385 domain-containing protein [Kaistella sp.]|uniref:DUF1385 domain-containing protein n=1 Tax=Kaistella sp. TaxID=2782235 RepID=UPI003C702ACA
MAKSQKKEKEIEPNPWFTTMIIFLSIISSIALFFIFKKIMNSEKELISITLLPLILGIVFDLKRLEVSWKNILTKIILAIGASLIFAFIPGKNEHHYDLDFHIRYFLFVFIFLLFSIISFIKEKNRINLHQSFQREFY